MPPPQRNDSQLEVISLRASAQQKSMSEFSLNIGIAGRGRLGPMAGGRGFARGGAAKRRRLARASGRVRPGAPSPIGRT